MMPLGEPKNNLRLVLLFAQTCSAGQTPRFEEIQIALNGAVKTDHKTPPRRTNRKGM